MSYKFGIIGPGLIADFNSRAIEGDKGLKSVEIILAFYESAEKGCEVFFKS